MADSSRLGRYEIRREIARSNDIVYEAVDTLMGRRVALKELALPPNLTGQGRQERVERFYREARAAGALTHRNIVTIYEVGEDHDRHYIAMEYLEGQTLRQVLDLKGALSIPETRELLVQTLDALGYAHANGVVHRDVKPDNLYLLTDGSVKLTDFGIARIMDEPSLTAAGQVFGTPSYMSPEQIAGKPIDERTDLYSTGVMAYEMLAGRKPFVGENVVALTYQILNVHPEPPRGLPQPLEAFLRKAMSKEPSERYQSARAMADALRGESPALPLPAFDPGAFTPAPAGSNAAPLPSMGGLPGSPTLPPGTIRRRRRRINESWRQFLIAVAGGIVIGTLLVSMALGIRSAYKSYTDTMKETAAQALYLQAVHSYKVQRYDLAIEQFRAVMRRAAGTPLAVNARQAMVSSYLDLGDAAMGSSLELARQEYQNAIDTDPRSAEAYLHLGDVLERLNHFKDAIDAWNQVIRIDGFGTTGMEARRQESIAYFNRGVGEFNAGNRDDARQYWQFAIDADPTGPTAQQAHEMIDRLLPSAFPGP